MQARYNYVGVGPLHVVPVRWVSDASQPGSHPEPDYAAILRAIQHLRLEQGDLPVQWNIEPPPGWSEPMFDGDPVAAHLGRLGGLAGGAKGGRSTSPAKRRAARANGRKGGRPPPKRPEE